MDRKVEQPTEKRPEKSIRNVEKPTTKPQEKSNDSAEQTTEKSMDTKSSTGGQSEGKTPINAEQLLTSVNKELKQETKPTPRYVMELGHIHPCPGKVFLHHSI